MILRAASAFYFRGTKYRPGDELPTDSPEYVDAWLRAGTAAYSEPPAAEEAPRMVKKARAATARAGQIGIATPAAGDDLVGVVPDPEKRGAVRQPAKRPGRKPKG